MFHQTSRAFSTGASCASDVSEVRSYLGFAYLAADCWQEGVVDVERLWREDDGPED